MKLRAMKMSPDTSY